MYIAETKQEQDEQRDLNKYISAVVVKQIKEAQPSVGKDYSTQNYHRDRCDIAVAINADYGQHYGA